MDIVNQVSTYNDKLYWFSLGVSSSAVLIGSIGVCMKLKKYYSKSKTIYIHDKFTSHS